MVKKLRIALVSMQCDKNKSSNNLKKCKEYIDRAEKSKVDIICFPELNISGYSFPKDYPGCVLKPDSNIIKSFCKLTKNKKIISLFGYIEKNLKGKPFISQIVVKNGKIVGTYHKRNIAPDEEFGHFDSPDKSHSDTFKVRDIKFGIAICADINNPLAFSELRESGAKIIFHASAPGLYHHCKTKDDWEKGYEWWKKENMDKISKYARKNKIYIAGVSQSGTSDGEDFPGGIYVFNPKGDCIAQLNDYKESSIIVEISIS